MKKVEPYNIGTPENLRKRLQKSLPPETRVERRLVAQMGPDPDGWFAIDPIYFTGELSAARKLGVFFLQLQASANVSVDLLIGSGRRPLAAAVEVRTSEEEPTSTRRTDATVAVDSATVMLALISRIERTWRIGGPSCRANLIAYQRSEQAQVQPLAAEVDAAVDALGRAGFTLLNENGRWGFATPLCDGDIAKIRAVLGATPRVRLNVYRSQTDAWIRQHLDAEGVATLRDDAGQPVAVAFRTAFGDGTYDVEALLSHERVVGHRISFVDQGS